MRTQTQKAARALALLGKSNGGELSGSASSARRACLGALLVVGLTACSGVEEYDGPYKTVVLITLDTVRADHLGCYGNEAGLTQALDRLASEGVRFADVTTAAPTTLASHTSIMTGTYPHTHGVPRNAFEVAEENVMLAEVLRSRGFDTAAFTGSWALDARFGFAQGFDVYDETFSLESDVENYDQDQRRAEDVTDAVLAYVDGSAAERRFLFVHYFDAHSPFDPPAPFRPDGVSNEGSLSDVKRAVHDHHARFLELAPFEETWPSQFDRSIKAAIPRAVREQADGEPLPIDADLAALYAGEIRYLDHHVGRLLEGLRERGELDGALVMVLSDHGETFHEHADYWNHGLAVYDTTVHVPWILWRSPELRVREEAGRTVDVPLSTVDVAPTLLALLDLERDEGLDGVSVLPAVRGERFERGPVYCEATQPLHRDAERGGWANRRKPRCLRSGPWKLVESPLHRTLELYDLDHDPGERQSLLETPEHAQRVEELLATLRGWTESGVPFPSRFLPAQQEDLRFRIMMMQRLQNSGYAGTGDESGDEPIEDAWGGGDGESR